MNLNCPNDIYHQRGKPALKKEGEHRIESPNTLRHSSPPSSSTERATSLWRSSMLTPIASNRIIERKQEARCSPEAKQSTARRSSDKSADEEEEEGAGRISAAEIARKQEKARRGEVTQACLNGRRSKTRRNMRQARQDLCSHNTFEHLISRGFLMMRSV